MFKVLDNVESVKNELARINDRLVAIGDKAAARMSGRDSQIDTLVNKNHDDRMVRVQAADLHTKLDGAL